MSTTPTGHEASSLPQSLDGGSKLSLIRQFEAERAKLLGDAQALIARERAALQQQFRDATAVKEKELNNAYLQHVSNREIRMRAEAEKEAAAQQANVNCQLAAARAQFDAQLERKKAHMEE
jgi:hypothetical protein